MTIAANQPGYRRRWTILVLAVAVGVALLALMFVPARTEAQTLTVAPGSTSSATFSFAGPMYVTMHFASPRGYGMQYWMHGPSGEMYNHSMTYPGMMGAGPHAAPDSDSYSFWTWGGQYRCGASSPNGGPGSAPVWINATSAIL